MVLVLPEEGAKTLYLAIPFWHTERAQFGFFSDC